MKKPRKAVITIVENEDGTTGVNLTFRPSVKPSQGAMYSQLALAAMKAIAVAANDLGGVGEEE